MGDQDSVWLPDAMSTIAPEVDALFWFVFWASTIIFAAVVIAKIYFVIRYRRRSEDEVPEAHQESKWLETAWIVLPTILVLIVFTWGFKVFVKMNSAPPDSFQVTVRAAQWFWEFEYENGVTSPNELYVPIGRPVQLNMSASDVLHSFFVPEFRIKMDVIPNRYTSVWFEPIATGDYQVFCTEYCGTQHSAMLATIHVVTQSEFDSWLQQQNQDLPPVELGEQVFVQYCAVCHATDGSRLVGPPMNGLMGTTREFEDGSNAVVDADYLRESIIDPSANVVATYPNAMPATFGSMTAKQIDGLIAYLQSLE